MKTKGGKKSCFRNFPPTTSDIENNIKNEICSQSRDNGALLKVERRTVKSKEKKN